jgi:hypothetical protein
MPSNVDLGESSSVMAISKPTRPGAQKQRAEKEYGMIPDGLPERKGTFYVLCPAMPILLELMVSSS